MTFRSACRSGAGVTPAAGAATWAGPSRRGEQSRAIHPERANAKATPDRREEADLWALHETLLREIEGRGIGQTERPAPARPAPARAAGDAERPAVGPPGAASLPGAPAARSVPRGVAEAVSAAGRWAGAATAAVASKASGAGSSAPGPEPALEPEHPQVPARERLNVVFVSAECAPWSKTGGLGDVASALPAALARRGHRVMSIAPRYEPYAEGWYTGEGCTVRLWGEEHGVGYFHSYDKSEGVDRVFLDHPAFSACGKDIYGGGREAGLFRAALLSLAALEALWLFSPGGAPYGDENTVLVANDWHAALLPVYLEARYRPSGRLTRARSVLVLHNIAHQGRYPAWELDGLEVGYGGEDGAWGELGFGKPGTSGVPSHGSGYEAPGSDRRVDGAARARRASFLLDDPVGGLHGNVLKAGVLAAHRLVAVSRGYAWEVATSEGGWGLDALFRDQGWKLRGIVNGIDGKEWDPRLDAFLTDGTVVAGDGAGDAGIARGPGSGFVRYSPETFVQGKAMCKAALREELQLPDPGDDVPLLAFVGRLDYQKGVDLIAESLPWIVGNARAQVVLLGSGRSDLEDQLRGMEAAQRDWCRAWVGFSVDFSHRLTAAADILLMPSRFEPCGLNQLYAMRYGTVPVVHAVGGLRDTVVPFDPFANSGTGWTFSPANGESFRTAVHHAIDTYRRHPESFRELQKRGMEQDLSWDHAAELYEDVLIDARNQWA